MSNADRDNILAGIYRNLEAADPAEALRLLRQIAELLVRIGGGLERAGIIARPNAAPVQSALPLDEGLPAPGTIMRAVPRVWGNYVRAYDALWREYAARPFRIDALYGKPETVKNATGGKLGVGSFRHVLTAIANASAATRNGRAYALRQPTDELREAVEAQHRGRRGA